MEHVWIVLQDINVQAPLQLLIVVKIIIVLLDKWSKYVHKEHIPQDSMQNIKQIVLAVHQEKYAN
jgi:hypothetical protein